MEMGPFATFPTYTADSVSVFDTSFGAMAAADFNGDGKPDLVVGVSVFEKSGYSDQIGLLLNNGAGFSPPIMTTLQGGSAILYPVAADFNGDGKMDLAIGDGEGVAILLGNGDGTFQPEVDYSGIGRGPTGTLPVAVGDFNNDDKTDVLGMNSTGGLAVILGNGNGTFGLPLNSPVGGNSTAFAVADFNGDGKLDVAALVTGLNPPRLLQIMTGNGDGTFSIGPQLPSRRQRCCHCYRGSEWRRHPGYCRGVAVLY
jgi:FG-GAP-like repeat